MSTLAPQTATSPPSGTLTPNTRSEAEAALTHNALVQSSCAGRPQPTTPLSPPSSNYLTASNSTPPAPEQSLRSVTSASPPPLSRGTTAAVLSKMSSDDWDFSGSALGRRVSGSRRSMGDEAGTETGEMSWKREDLKHSLMQQYLGAPQDRFGYSSARGTPVQTG